MIAHSWHAKIEANGKTHSFGGVDRLPKSCNPQAQYPFIELLERVVRKAADKEFGEGNWRVVRPMDPYAWNALPASDYGASL